MSQALYDSMLQKWQDLLSTSHEIRFGCGSLIHEDEAAELYDDLVAQFQKEEDYSDKTIEMAFYDEWFDTFADKFYLELERRGTNIIHADPMGGDWDYGKKFRFNPKGYWEEGEEAR